jgi:hypothetical protein
VLTELFGEPTPLMTDDDVSKNRVSHVWGLVPGGGGELPLGVPNRFLHMCTPGHHQEQKQCTLTYSLQQDLRSLHDNLSLTLTHPVLADVIAPEEGGTNRTAQPPNPYPYSSHKHCMRTLHSV